MADFDLVVRGGTVATASGVFEGDVGVVGEEIVAVGKNLSKGSQEIDAKGRIVLPGGVDSHCHIEQPSSTGGVNADTFLSGTRAAVCGGTTSVICFAPPFPTRRLASLCKGGQGNVHSKPTRLLQDAGFLGRWWGLITTW